MKISLSEYIATRISELDIEYVFGVPGSYIMSVWEEVAKKNKIVLGCHETGAGFMAEGFSRAKRKSSVLLTTSAPGVTNAVTAIANAYMDSVPLLIISGQVSTDDIGKGAFQECSNLNRSFSQNSLLSSITKSQIEIVDINNAQFLFESAINIANSGRPGPVHITLPINIQKQKFNFVKDSLYNFGKSEEYIDNDDIIKIINLSKRPLIYVGWGAFLSDSAKLIEKLSLKITAPIITSLKGLSNIKTDSLMYVGHLGMGADDYIIDFLKKYDCDLIIVLGSSLSKRTVAGAKEIFEKAPVLNINIDHSDSLKLNNQKYIIADIKQFVESILHKLDSKDNIGIKNKILDFKYKTNIKKISNIDTRCLNMSYAINLINDYTDENTVFFPDSGNHWLDCLSLLTLKNYNSMFLSMGLATMGYSFGSAVGYALANPLKKVVIIGGDGSFLMSGNEIVNAIRYKLNLVVIIINNSSLGRVRIGMRDDAYTNFSTSDIDDISYCEIGKGLGFKTFKVLDISHLKKAYKYAFSKSEPILIEVVVNKDDTPLFLRKGDSK